MMNGNRIGAALALATLVLAGVSAAPARSADMVVATGEKGALYHQVGRAICRFLRRRAEDLTCLPLPTAAGDTTESIANLNNVRGGAVELGLAQADTQFHAVNHSGPFEFMDNTYENLRTVFSLYSQEFTLLARADSGIRSIDDLKGRRVNIGNPGSAERQLMEQVMAAKGWSDEDFLLTEELPSTQQSLAFCHDRVQAMVYNVAHPDATVRRVAELCDAVIIPVKGPAIDKLVSERAYYTHSSVPGGLYARNPEPVATFGVTATLVSSIDVDAETIYAIVKTVFDNFDAFKAAHPSFSDLEPAQMVQDGLSAPLHHGALRYYNEKGMM
jgi:TRAP transporter TAXI family solute receptor